MDRIDYDAKLRLLRRELSLVMGHQTQPTKIPAAHSPPWRRLFEPRAVQGIRNSAARVETILNEQIPKPETREDHDLLKAARSPDQIERDISAIPKISAKCLPDASVRLEEFTIFQLWFVPPDRYAGREAPGLVISRAPVPADVIHDASAKDSTVWHHRSGQVEVVQVQSDERDRSALSDVGDRAYLTLSVAAHALLTSDIRVYTDPRRGDCSVFLGHPKQHRTTEDDPSMLLHRERKVDRQSESFLIFESRNPDADRLLHHSR